MIIASKQKQVEKIKKYIENNSNLYNKLVIFGKCITDEGKDTDYLDVAVQTVDQSMADDNDALLDLFCAIDDITEGLFDLTIINCQNNSSNTIKEINKGEVIYAQATTT